MISTPDAVLQAVIKGALLGRFPWFHSCVVAMGGMISLLGCCATC